jgi:hypothetical protein
VAHARSSRRWAYLLLALAGLAAVGLFSVRAWHQWSYTERVQSGALQVESLRGWMTLPYIEKAYGVPQARVREVLGLPASGNDERSLREWLDESGQDPEAGRRKVEDLILKAAPAASRP